MRVQDINEINVFPMKFTILRPLLSESVTHILPLLVFYDDHNMECPMTKFEHFSERSFGEICS